MHPRVPQHMLGDALDVVDLFGREHVADELGVQVQRMVRRAQREAEIVHREDVFQQLGIVFVPYATGLAGGVQPVRQIVGAGVEIVVVVRFVDAHPPQRDGRMIPVAPDHLPDVPHGDILPGLVSHVLPAGDLLEHQQAGFVAGIQEMRRLRIVRGAHEVALQVVLKNEGVAPLHPGGHGAAHVREGLVAVQPAQFQVLPIEEETLFGEAGLAEPDPH